jgi:hypothetical protein
LIAIKDHDAGADKANAKCSQLPSRVQTEFCGVVGHPRPNKTSKVLQTEIPVSRKITIVDGQSTFLTGTQVIHKIKGDAFGDGLVIFSNNETLIVEFQKIGRKIEFTAVTAGNFLQQVSGR